MTNDHPVLDQEQAVRNFSDLNLFISGHVRYALQAALVMRTADAFFAKQRETFGTNPANTLPYQALVALEDRSLVYVAETLRDEHGLRPTTAAVRRRQDLFLHRHALSHPGTVRWRNPAMQTFTEQERQWRDLRPALLWDLQKSINEELRAHGLPPDNEDIVLTMEMARQLHLILDLARGPARAVPEPIDLLGHMQAAKEVYIRFLEAHPDGQAP